MRIYARYLVIVLQHKWFVLLECWKAGIPLRGLTHDLSKFRPDEFFPYAEHHVGGRRSIEDKKRYQQAWVFHQNRNKHHWQYWINRKTKYSSEPIEMDRISAIEMACDLRAAEHYPEATDAKTYYLGSKEDLLLHDNTRQLLESQLGLDFEESGYDPSDEASLTKLVYAKWVRIAASMAFGIGVVLSIACIRLDLPALIVPSVLLGAAIANLLMVISDKIERRAIREFMS